MDRGSLFFTRILAGIQQYDEHAAKEAKTAGDDDDEEGEGEKEEKEEDVAEEAAAARRRLLLLFVRSFVSKPSGAGGRRAPGTADTLPPAHTVPQEGRKGLR